LERDFELFADAREISLAVFCASMDYMNLKARMGKI
jgi:hypothetical protein